jgi:hypothetical protein
MRLAYRITAYLDPEYLTVDIEKKVNNKLILMVKFLKEAHNAFTEQYEVCF